MNDDELKALVSLGREASDYLTEHNVEFPNKPSLYRELADAIEALMAERDEARQGMGDWRLEAAARQDAVNIVRASLAAAEARAERAEAALRSLLALSETMFSDREEPRIARAVLAQIKKEPSDDAD